MKKLLLTGAMLASACSGKGEIIPTPSPEPNPPTTLQPINSAALAAPEAPTTTVPATTTTEPEPTTVPTVPPRRASTTTTQYLREEATSEWAIPTYIVMCESGGNWNARNASGAAGPYQLMPEHFGGQSALLQSRQAQHDMAAYLWNGGVNTRSGLGPQNWKACL